MTPADHQAAQAWNRSFAVEEFIFGREPNAYLRAQADVLPRGGRALCVADGEGRNSVWLARHGLEVDAFDVADAAVAKACQLAREAGVTVHTHVASCDSWNWQADTYDLIAAIFVQFADPALRARLFQCMIWSLKPGGLLILQGYTPRQLEYKTGGPGHVSHFYTAAMLQEAFSSLDIREMIDYEADLQEGRRHVGKSALIGMVAVKPGASREEGRDRLALSSASPFASCSDAA